MGRIGISNLISPSRKSATVALAGAAVCPILATAFSGSAYATESIGNGQTTFSASLPGSSVSIATDGNVNVEVIPTGSGSLGVAVDNVRVTTDAAEGYTLYLSGNNADRNGYTSLYFNGHSESANKITGLASQDAVSFSTANQWGYAVPTVSGRGYAAKNKYDAIVNNGTTADSGTISELKWRGISPYLAVVKRGATGTESTPVYYGVYVNDQIMTGDYRNTITYTAFVEGNGLVDVIYDQETSKMTVTTEYKANGYPVTADKITINLYNNTPGTSVGTCNNITVLQNGSTDQLKFTCDVALNPGVATNTLYDVEVKVHRDDNNYFSYYSNDSWFKLQTIADIHYMHEMTSPICDATPTPTKTAVAGSTGDDGAVTTSEIMASVNGDGKATIVPQVILTDYRDGKEYLVRKLADGNCWMAQNLEFNILGSSQSYATAKTSTVAGNDNNDLAVGTDTSKYFGTLVADDFALDSNYTDIQSGKSWAEIKARTRIFATITTTRESTNSEYGWANHGTDGWRSYSYDGSKTAPNNWNYSVKNGTNSNNIDTFTSAAEGKRYARYGNLYNWTAATLGSGLGLTADGANAQDSICPKGWKLPYNAAVTVDGQTVNDSWYNLVVTTYGLLNSYYLNGNSANGDFTNTDFNKINQWPLNLMRTGYYRRSYGYIGSRTTEGLWWSSTSSSATNARRLYTDTGRINAQNSASRGLGFAVRCVAR